MRKEFRKFDKNHIRTISMKVDIFNELIKETGIRIKTKNETIKQFAKEFEGRKEFVLQKYTEKDYIKEAKDYVECMACFTDCNDKSIAREEIAKYLGLKRIDYIWDYTGEWLNIAYTLCEEDK